MVNLFSSRVCSGSSYEENPTTTDYIVTSEYLARELYNEDELDVDDIEFFNGITNTPNEIDDQLFYGSGSAIIRTPRHEIAVCIYPRGDLRDNHVNFNMRWHLKSHGTVFRRGDIELPISIHMVDANVARIKLFDSSGNEFADNTIPLNRDRD